ncbi:MAG: hypothetical protein IIA30_11950 [Myxococcales bacterium]|nr:hypothetical protein [Myxococcales bacterium]
MIRIDRFGFLALFVGGGMACAGLDNPTALADLVLDVEFNIEATRVETFDEVEIHVQVREGSAHLQMLESRMEIEHHASGIVRTVEMHPEGDGYAAHVTFYEPGEYHLQFHGMPDGHRLSRAMGEQEIDVFRHHLIAGPYWVEIESSPAPVVGGGEAHIHLMAYELLPDGTPGLIAAGLDMEVEVHGLDGSEMALGVEEETPGEYEIQYEFAGVGLYEFHVEIGEDRGEFHFPVIDLEAEEDTAEEGEGGGHGHGP